MRFSAVFALGFAAFVMATPVPEAEAAVAEIQEKRSLPGTLPHPIGGVGKIMSPGKPSGLVTRQDNSTAPAPAAKKGLFLELVLAYFHY